MRFAIIADIHANLEAFQTVLEDSRKQGCTHHAFLGDFVGYGADPEECVAIVRAMGAPCVKGNHDEYCATNHHLGGFNAAAGKAIAWTRGQLTADDRRWLGNLPYVQTVEHFTIVHATLDGPGRWGYVFDRLAAAASMNFQKTQICFFGHTHLPVAFVQDGAVRGGSYTKLQMERGKKYFVNAGSVGQPRDNDPKTAYVIYDMDEATIELRRLNYDFGTTQRKIREAGLGDD